MHRSGARKGRSSISLNAGSQLQQFDDEAYAHGIDRTDRETFQSIASYVQSGAMGDRTLFVPSHTGRHILPCHSLFQRLLRFAHQRPARLAIRDSNDNTEATHIQLLTDVLSLRERLVESLSQDIQDALSRREEVYIAVLAPGGYQYTVAMLAVLALGAAVVPLTVALPREEALYFAQKARAAAVIAASGALRLGQHIRPITLDY